MFERISYEADFQCLCQKPISWVLTGFMFKKMLTEMLLSGVSLL